MTTSVPPHIAEALASLPRAAVARAGAEQAGFTGFAVDLVVSAGAPARHSARVAIAIEAALDAAAGAGGTWARDPGLAAVLCRWEVAGSGGHLGALGGATTRAPWARCLGKGRRQASDGAAWTAAIEEAGETLANEAGVYELPTAADRIAQISRTAGDTFTAALRREVLARATVAGVPGLPVVQGDQFLTSATPAQLSGWLTTAELVTREGQVERALMGQLLAGTADCSEGAGADALARASEVLLRHPGEDAPGCAASASVHALRWAAANSAAHFLPVGMSAELRDWAADLPAGPERTELLARLDAEDAALAQAKAS